ncbi:MAG TPA: hypothetical protein VGK39_04435 [Cyclobacteriaceae bacterium]
MNNSFKVIAIVFFALVLVQCTKNETSNGEPKGALNGSWKVESFKLEGEEQIQHTFSSFKVEFKKKTANTGTTLWTIVKNSGSTQTTESDYTILNDGSRIEIDGDALNIEINGDSLTMEGNVGGLNFEINAEKE